MATTLEMTFAFDPGVSYRGTTTALPAVTISKSFGSDSDVVRFLTAYRVFLNQAVTASASTIVTAWWTSVTNDLVSNVGCTAAPITLS